MKAIVLGGFGMVGSSVARDLIKRKEITKVILAGRKIHQEGVHESVKASSKVSTQIVDVTDFDSLVNVVKGNDIVINTAGPYYRYGFNTMKAAIEAGVNYIDCCDDYDASRKAFDLDELAKSKGVLIAIGFGGAPGTTTLLAKYAADKLDVVDEVRVLWVAGINDPVGPGALTHATHMFSGKIPQYIDGQWVDVEAGSGAEVVEFLEPVGRDEVYFVGHPEPVTLPRYLKGVKSVINKGGIWPSSVSKLFMDFSRRGFFGTEPLTVGGASIVPRDFMVNLMSYAPQFKKEFEKYTNSPSNIIVKGKEGNSEVTYTYRFSGAQLAGTAISASIGAQLICRGEVKVKEGVVAAEGVVDPVTYFAEFAKKGLRIFEEKTIKQEIKV
jgi:lysine 6-dehydrogenase